MTSEPLQPIGALDSPWRNVYWFARALINTDQYGGVGSESKHIIHLSAALRTIYDAIPAEDEQAKAEALISLKDAVRNALLSGRRAGTKVSLQIEDLAAKLNERLKSIADVGVLIFTCEQVLIPLNAALDNIPNDDREFSETIVQEYLDAQGEAALPTVINMWDDFGVEGSLNAERQQIVTSFRALRQHLEAHKALYATGDADYILTAFVQEFERRAGQKRKGRAGGSLEDVTSVILNHFRIPTTHAPEHFQADIEVDKWIQTADRWLIGISCKRTLRERWKQVSSASAEVLSRYRIRELWHVITYSKDLTDDKLTTLGAGRQIFYLPDDSPAYQYFSKHQGMAAYVRPMSRFISDLRAVQKRSK